LSYRTKLNFLSFHKNLDSNHWLLLLMWVLYCLIHSVLAMKSIKSFVAAISGSFFRYYRLVYTLLATTGLLALLYFQYSLASPMLISEIAVQYISLIILVLPGVLVMMISIIKYFKLLSGIRTLYEAKPSAELLKKGIHNYIRHPLYSGTLLFTWGLFFIFPMLNNLIAAGVITGYVFLGIQLEEKKLLIEFGDSYLDYMSRVPMLIPDFKRLKQNKKGQPGGHP
jgi:protein-S-isoprenylcysteine O-methyltransferase Ste14